MLLGQRDSFRQRHATWLILQFADRFQRRGIASIRIEIEPERFRELKLRDAIIILRADQERILVRKRDLRLEHVETRHGAGFEPVLLILQLTLEKA